MNQENFCDGVKMLLNRMDSNPEEFVDLAKWNKFIPKPRVGKQNEYGQWDNEMDTCWGNYKADVDWFLSPEEVKAIHEKVKNVFKDRYTQDLMKVLFKSKRGAK